MSDGKRVSLQSIGPVKKDKKAKPSSTTIRLCVTLPHCNSDTYGDFNYKTLLANEKKKVKEKESPKLNGSGLALDPYASDDEDQLQQIARKFESKYGTPKNKYHRLEDYKELGTGYDENDSFIDNTDAYDEVVPDDQTPECGGFYINKGDLVLKQLPGRSSDDQSDSDTSTSQRKGVKRAISESEADDEDGEEDSDESDSSDDDDEDDCDAEKLSNEVKSNGHVFSENQAKKQKLSLDDNSKKTVCEPPAKKPKNKDRAITELYRKKAVVEKDHPSDKRRIADSDVSGKEIKKTNHIDETIEAVAQGESSSESGNSANKSKHQVNGSSNGVVQNIATNLQNTEYPMPANLPDSVLQIVAALKTKASAAPMKGSKKYIFSKDVDSILLRLDKDCCKVPTSDRMNLYRHLSYSLNCTPEELIRKIKSLVLRSREENVKEPLTSLRAGISVIMPMAIERYKRVCNTIEQERMMDAQKEVGPNGTKSSPEKMKIPRRRFAWTDELRNLLCQAVHQRKLWFKVAKPTGEVWEEHLKSFLKTDVEPMWEQGWMKVSSLMDIIQKNAPDLLQFNPSPSSKKMVGPKKGLAKSSSAAMPQSSSTAMIKTEVNKIHSSNNESKQRPLLNLSINARPTENSPLDIDASTGAKKKMSMPTEKQGQGSTNPLPSQSSVVDFSGSDALIKKRQAMSLKSALSQSQNASPQQSGSSQGLKQCNVNILDILSGDVSSKKSHQSGSQNLKQSNVNILDILSSDVSSKKSHQPGSQNLKQSNVNMLDILSSDVSSKKSHNLSSNMAVNITPVSTSSSVHVSNQSNGSERTMSDSGTKKHHSTVKSVQGLDSSNELKDANNLVKLKPNSYGLHSEDLSYPQGGRNIANKTDSSGSFSNKQDTHAQSNKSDARIFQSISSESQSSHLSSKSNNRSSHKNPPTTHCLSMYGPPTSITQIVNSQPYSTQLHDTTINISSSKVSQNIKVCSVPEINKKLSTSHTQTNVKTSVTSTSNIRPPSVESQLSLGVQHPKSVISHSTDSSNVLTITPTMPSMSSNSNFQQGKTGLVITPVVSSSNSASPKVVHQSSNLKNYSERSEVIVSAAGSNQMPHIKSTSLSSNVGAIGTNTTNTIVTSGSPGANQRHAGGTNFLNASGFNIPTSSASNRTHKIQSMHDKSLEEVHRVEKVKCSEPSVQATPASFSFQSPMENYRTSVVSSPSSVKSFTPSPEKVIVSRKDRILQDSRAGNDASMPVLSGPFGSTSDSPQNFRTHQQPRARAQRLHWDDDLYLIEDAISPALPNIHPKVITSTQEMSKNSSIPILELQKTDTVLESQTQRRSPMLSPPILESQRSNIVSSKPRMLESSKINHIMRGDGGLSASLVESQRVNVVTSAPLQESHRISPFKDDLSDILGGIPNPILSRTDHYSATNPLCNVNKSSSSRPINKTEFDDVAAAAAAAAVAALSSDCVVKTSSEPTYTSKDLQVKSMSTVNSDGGYSVPSWGLPGKNTASTKPSVPMADQRMTGLSGMPMMCMTGLDGMGETGLGLPSHLVSHQNEYQRDLFGSSPSGKIDRRSM